MKWFIPIGLALAALHGPAMCVAQTAPSGVRDGAHLFSDEAVRKAGAALDAVRKDRGWQVVIETVESLGGASPRDRAVEGAKRLNIHGLYVLIARDEHKVWVEPSRSAEGIFSRDRINAITESITRAFKAKEFDRGLLDAVALVREDAAAGPGGVRDGAKLFSSDAVKKADQEIAAIARQTKRQVVVETTDSLHGQPIEAQAVANAKKLNVHGLYVLISKEPHRIWVQPSGSASGVFSRAKVKEIETTLRDAFRAKQFDKGLHDALAEVRKDVSVASLAPAAEAPRARTEAAPPPPAAPPAAPPPAEVPVPKAVPAVSSRLPLFLAIGVGAIVLLWLFSRASGASRQAAAPQGLSAGQPAGPPGYPPAPGPARVPPGYGPGQAPPPPGYGPGPGYVPGPGYPAGGYGPAPQQGAGGGFMSGMLGGLGGAVVGNILYDKFGHPHHHEGQPAPTQGGMPGGMPPAGYPQGSAPTQPPTESYDPNAGAGGDWGDSGAAAAPAGEDWTAGGGAGGDWGGPEPQASGDAAAGQDWDQGAGAGGDWGQGAGGDDSAGAGGDWGQDAGAAEGGDAGGGDWSQDAGTDDTNQGADW